MHRDIVKLAYQLWRQTRDIRYMINFLVRRSSNLRKPSTLNAMITETRILKTTIDTAKKKKQNPCPNSLLGN